MSVFRITDSASACQVQPSDLKKFSLQAIAEEAATGCYFGLAGLPIPKTMRRESTFNEHSYVFTRCHFLD